MNHTEIASPRVFEQALAEYRQKWPRDGYYDAAPRFVETYKLFSSYYQGGKVLDVGGWPGDLACTLATLKVAVVALDKSIRRPTAKVLDATTGKQTLQGTTTLAEKCLQYGVSTLECNIEREPIPLPDGSVSFILFTEVIEHLRVGLLHALREIRRVLDPEGRMLLTTPNLLSLRNRISFLLGKAKYDTLEMPYAALEAEERIGHNGHFRIFSMPELNDLLAHTGFRVLYQGYRQLMPVADGKLPWSFYRLRHGLKDRLVRFIKPLGNTIFLVLTRD